MNNKRFYNFILVIYEDDDLFFEQYSNLTNIKDSIWIRHDKDLDEEGNFKKPHYHFVLKLKNAKTISALSKEVNVSSNMIEPVKKSLNGSLRYLIHYGCDDKHQYLPEDIETNSDKLKRKFLDLVTDDVPEVDKVINIQEYIESFPDTIKWSILSRYVQKINMWDAFRRNMTFFTKLVDEHNADIFTKKYMSGYNNYNIHYNHDNIDKYS